MEFTDGEAHMIETCKTNIMDAANKDNVREAVIIIAKTNVRNDCFFVRAYDGSKISNSHWRGIKK